MLWTTRQAFKRGGEGGSKAHVKAMGTTHALFFQCLKFLVTAPLKWGSSSSKSMAWMNPSRRQIINHRVHPHPGPRIISWPITGHVQDTKKTDFSLFVCISKMSGWVCCTVALRVTVNQVEPFKIKLRSLNCMPGLRKCSVAKGIDTHVLNKYGDWRQAMLNRTLLITRSLPVKYSLFSLLDC